MAALSGEGGVEMLDLATDVSRDLALLDVLRSCLADLDIRSEVREHLMSLVVFRSSPGLPVCVFVSSGRFYCWDHGLRRAPVLHVQGVAADLAELMSGTNEACGNDHVPCEGRAHQHDITELG